MHHPMGAVSCVQPTPSRSKGEWGTGLVGIVERDAISPGRALGTSQSTQRTGLCNTFAENKLPPKNTHSSRLEAQDHCGRGDRSNKNSTLDIVLMWQVTDGWKLEDEPNTVQRMPLFCSEVIINLEISLLILREDDPWQIEIRFS